MNNKIDRESIERLRFVDPAVRKAEARKKKQQKAAGFLMFEFFLLLSFLNFLLGGFFFKIMNHLTMSDNQVLLVYGAVALCFINCLAMFIIAIESYYVHVANKKREWIELQYREDDV